MQALGQYAVSVAAVAILTSILTSLVPRDTDKGILRLVCGLVMTIAVIRPVYRVDLSFQELFDFPQLSGAESAVEEGKALAKDTMADIIKDTCEAYILDKAHALGAEITVHISVDADNVPIAADLRGKITPGTRERLEKILEADLGIAKENQSWTR